MRLKTKRKINVLMLIQWLFFFLPMFVVGILIGALEGFARVFQQAERDVFGE